jgi:uncharacterized membrane protein YagU involved in acid resistance
MAKKSLISVMMLMMLALVWLKPLDELAATHAEAGLKRAVASFATARVLNGVISVLQGTEVSAGVVVGVKLAPGQILDPLNDMVEQFSTMMLAASIAFGAQILLMQMSASWAMSLALTLVVCVWVVQYAQLRMPHGWLTRIMVALLLVRFIMPVAALSSELAYQAFMAEDYTRNQRGIEQSAAVLGALEAKDDAPKWWEVRERIEQIKAVVDRTVDHSIRIAVVFLLQTLVLPLLAFWILLHGSRMLMTERVPGA